MAGTLHPENKYIYIYKASALTQIYGTEHGVKRIPKIPEVKKFCRLTHKSIDLNSK